MSRQCPTQIRKCQELWIMVLIQALSDATSISNKPESNHIRSSAHAWLTSNNKDFRMVCDLAGLNPDKAAAKCRRILRGETVLTRAETLAEHNPHNIGGYFAQGRPGPKPKRTVTYLPLEYAQ